MGLTPDFKDTEWGSIPTDWSFVPLGDLCSHVTSGSRGWAQFYSEYGDLFVRITNLRRSSIQLDLSDCRFVRLPDDNTEGARTGLIAGDLLISITADLGIVGLVPPGLGSAYINQHIALARIATGSAHSTYVALALASEEGRRRFEQLNDSGSKAGLNLPNVRSVRVPLPPTVAEQEAIAEALSDADALIESLEQLIAKKRLIKQGVMQELLTGKRRLPGFAGEWVRKELRELTRATAGGTPSTAVSDYWGGSIPWMASGELHKKRVVDVVGRITESGLANSSATLIPEKCVLIGLAGQGKTRGTVAINEVPLTTNQSIAAVLPCPQLAPDYLFHNLDARYTELRELSAGDGGRGGLNLTLIGKLEVPVPTLEEQIAIARVLNDLDADLNSLHARLSKVHNLKQCMMQQLLTGRIRLV